MNARKATSQPITALLALLLPLLLPLATAAQAPCGPTEVCRDTVASFYGQLLLDGIRLDWDTDGENGAILEYRIKRYDCSVPANCTVDVVTIAATGACGTTEPYSYTDAPPSPLSSWTYTLEVWRTDQNRACSIDTIPE